MAAKRRRTTKKQDAVRNSDSVSNRKKGSADRLPDGRFRPGHSLPGPGNPNLRRLSELQTVVREAGTPERLRTVLDGLYDMATDAKLAPSDRIAAARVYLERCAGKPKDMQSEPIAFTWPDIETVADVPKAARAILAAVAGGEITPDDAVKLTGAVELFRRGIADSEFERRLQVLEESKG